MTGFKTATLNLPSQVRGAKRVLFPHPRRTNAAIRLWNREGISIVALQELATVSRVSIRARRRWGLVVATNNIFPRRKIGNGVAFRKDLWKVLDKKVHIIPCPGRPRGLRMVLVLLEHRKNGDQVFVYAIHNPTQRDASDETRAAILAEEIRVFKILSATGVAVIPAGDFNDGSVNFGGAEVGSHFRADWIFGENLKWSSMGVDTTVHGGITDHGGMPWAVGELSTIAPRLTKIPAIAA